jgi:type II secretory pathway pseudopilin PulG
MMNQKGQTLLEVILAFGIVILVLGSISSVVVTSLNNTQYAKNQSMATSYAQEGINVVRSISDSGWNQLLYYKDHNDGKYCIKSDLSLNAALSENCTGADAIGPSGAFSRKVTLDSISCNSGGIHATVKVSWTDGACNAAYCHHVDLESCFENYDLKSTP